MSTQTTREVARTIVDHVLVLLEAWDFRRKSGTPMSRYCGDVPTPVERDVLRHHVCNVLEAQP